MILLNFLQVLWIPDVIIHDLVMFSKPEILNEVAALEIFKNGKVYYKIRQVLSHVTCLDYDSDRFKENGIKVFFTILKWYFLL